MSGQNNNLRFTSPKEEVHNWQSYETMAVGPCGTTNRDTSNKTQRCRTALALHHRGMSLQPVNTQQ